MKSQYNPMTENHPRDCRYLKAMYPNVNIAIHGGELALGMVPPTLLSHHVHDSGMMDRWEHRIQVSMQWITEWEHDHR